MNTHAKVCPHCSYLNPGDTVLCVRCGRMLKARVDLNPPWLQQFIEEYEAEWQERMEQ